MATTQKAKTLFRMEEKGATADKKGSLFCGYVGNYELGSVVAANKAAAKKKLLAIARKMLK